jgi:hypothetical protein
MKPAFNLFQLKKNNIKETKMAKSFLWGHVSNVWTAVTGARAQAAGSSILPASAMVRTQLHPLLV